MSTSSEFLSKLFSTYSNALGALSSEALASCNEVAAKVEAAVADGVQLADVPVLLAQVGRLAAVVAASSQGMTDEAKKTFVAQVVTTVYMRVDRGESGNENKIDIPWLPNTLERPAENFLVPLLATVIAEAIVAGMNAVEEKLLARLQSATLVPAASAVTPAAPTN